MYISHLFPHFDYPFYFVVAIIRYVNILLNAPLLYIAGREYTKSHVIYRPHGIFKSFIISARLALYINSHGAQKLSGLHALLLQHSAKYV